MAESLAIETVGAAEALRRRSRRCAGSNLRVPPGSIFGFLGRNGAGKTTTIKVLLGMARPTGGQARVFGLAADDAGGERRDPAAHRLRRARTRTSTTT